MVKHIFSIASIACAILMGGMLTSCSSDGNEVTSGTGNLVLNIDANPGFTRALNEDSYKSLGNYTVEIIDGEGVVKESFDYDETHSIELLKGTYTVHAFCGTEHDASRDEFLCEGRQIVNVSEEETNVNMTCAPTCGKTVVKFNTDMDKYFDNYYVTYQTKALGAKTVTWAKDDTEPWYLLVDASGETVTATIHLVPKAAYDVNKTHTEGATTEGTVVKTYVLQPNHSWTLNIAPNYSQTTGTLGITIDIDESTNDKEVDIEIPSEWI